MYNRDMSFSKLKFIKKEFLEDDYKLIVIDEYSMVNKQQSNDLPILVSRC